VTALRLAAVALAGALAACASVTSGITQQVKVTPVCEGRIVSASCELSNDKGHWSVAAPGAITIGKSFGDLSVACRAMGSTGTANFVSKSNNNIAGNILLGGLIGAAVDSASGAGFQYPEELPVVLDPPCDASGAAQRVSSTKGERE
jgi:hypothetical protein